MSRILATLIVVLVAALSVPCAAADAQPNPADYFNTKVHPILETSCIECHGAKKQKGKLRLDSAAALKKGGTDGAVVVPGKPEQSMLIKAVSHTDPDLKMPKKKLSDEQITILTNWVKMGAVWPEGTAAGK